MGLSPCLLSVACPSPGRFILQEWALYPLGSFSGALLGPGLRASFSVSHAPAVWSLHLCDCAWCATLSVKPPRAVHVSAFPSLVKRRDSLMCVHACGVCVSSNPAVPDCPEQRCCTARSSWFSGGCSKTSRVTWSPSYADRGSSPRD